jgi:predicted nucleic acid-binding protein
MVFLDANPVIYLIEQPAGIGPKVATRIAELLASGERLAVSDLVRMECQVGPLKADDSVLLAKYKTFFSSPDLDVLPVSSSVCDRAARIRPQYGFKPLDSLLLAAAAEHRCGLFLTRDAQLKRFTDVVVETLT